jgi:hypothetical protein
LRLSVQVATEQFKSPFAHVSKMDVPRGASFFDAFATIRSAGRIGSIDRVRGVSAIAIVG